MKIYYKKVLLSLFALCFICLSACTPSVPSDLTAPPSSGSENTVYEKTVFDGIGTVCDIVPYGERYLVLTHSGLYTVDQNFENRERLGSPYNDPFDKCEDGTFFYRLTAVTNYDDVMLFSLCVEDDHIFFYCHPTRSFFFDGKETRLEEHGINIGDEETYCIFPMIHNDSVYLLYKNTLLHEGKTAKYDEKEIWSMVEYEDKLYLNCKGWYPNYEDSFLVEVQEDLSFGNPMDIEVEEWKYYLSYRDLSAPGETDSIYRYRIVSDPIESEPDEYGLKTMGYHYSFSRTDGDTVETLQCEEIDELLNGSDRYFLYVKEDKQFVIFTVKDNRVNVSVPDFTVK